MRIALEMIVFAIIIPAILIWVGNEYIKSKKRAKKLVDAYFTGGPLNGISKKLQGQPDRFTYQYRQTVGSTVDAKTPWITTYQDEPVTAIYELKGPGTYLYLGTLDAKGKLQEAKKES